MPDTTVPRITNRLDAEREGIMRGRLLFLNPKGFHRYDRIHQELSLLGWDVSILDVDEPRSLRWYSMVRSFRPSRQRWRRNLAQIGNQVGRTSVAFRCRSKLNARKLQKFHLPYNIIFQIGGMSAPSWPLPEIPYVLFSDCTVKLGEGEPLSGVNFRTSGSAKRWYDLEGMLYRRANYIFTTSEYVRRSLIQDYGVEATQAVVVGGGPNLKAPDALNKSYDRPTLLYVGYEFERKGGPILLAAFRRVKAEIPNAELLIAGPRWIPEALPPGVRWLGPMSSEDLSQLYATASLFVMPSLFEPFGLAFLEAMEHKLPCIGSDRCAMPEIIREGETGFIVPAADAGALAEKIIFLLNRRELMGHMGEQGRRRVREFLTWPAVVRRIDKILIDLIERPDHPTPSSSFQNSFQPSLS